MVNTIEQDYDEFEESRRCLINSYDSYIQNHAGLLIAVIIGGLALLTEWRNFIINGFWFGTGVLVFIGLIALVIFGFFYIVSRMSYWTKYADVALSVSQKVCLNTWKKGNVKDKDDEETKPSCTAIIQYTAAIYIFEMIQGKGKTKFGSLDE